MNRVRTLLDLAPRSSGCVVRTTWDFARLDSLIYELRFVHMEISFMQATVGVVVGVTGNYAGWMAHQYLNTDEY